MKSIYQLTFVFAFFGAACESAELDTLDGGTVIADGGVVEPKPDANVPEDAGLPEPDSGVQIAARTFVERRIFGETRVDNLVFDPNFDLTSYNWYAFSADFSEYIPLEKHSLPNTPTHQPAVRVAKDPGTRGALMLGSAASAQGLVEASVWVGRSAEDATAGTPSGTIVTIGEDGAETAIDLSVVAGSRQELGGIVWERVSTMISEPLGVMAFLIGDQGAAPFWVTAPTVLPVREQLRPGPRTPLIGRAPALHERNAIAAFQTAKKKDSDPRKSRARRR